MCEGCAVLKRRMVFVYYSFFWRSALKELSALLDHSILVKWTILCFAMGLWNDIWLLLLCFMFMGGNKGCHRFYLAPFTCKLDFAVIHAEETHPIALLSCLPDNIWCIWPLFFIVGVTRSLSMSEARGSTTIHNPFSAICKQLMHWDWYMTDSHP